MFIFILDVFIVNINIYYVNWGGRCDGGIFIGGKRDVYGLDGVIVGESRDYGGVFLVYLVCGKLFRVFS